MRSYEDKQNSTVAYGWDSQALDSCYYECAAVCCLGEVAFY